FHFLVAQLADFFAQRLGTLFQLLDTAEDFGEEVAHRSDSTSNSVLDGSPDLLDGIHDTFEGDRGSSRTARCTTEAFQRRRYACSFQTQTVGVGAYSVLHEHS